MKLVVIEIPNYIREIQLSKSRRPKYYPETDSIPKRYQNDRYGFINGYLYELETSTKLVKNKAYIQKPRFKRIQGQDIWRGINFNLRSKISKEIKKYFYEQFRGIPYITEYPLEIRIDYYDKMNEGEDLDNLAYWYRKCIHDALCGNVEFNKVNVEKEGKTVQENIPDREKYPQIIVDDSKKYIQSIPTKFHPIKDDETPKMVIEISKI